MYVCIYIQRERERERDMYKCILTSIFSSSFSLSLGCSGTRCRRGPRTSDTEADESSRATAADAPESEKFLLCVFTFYLSSATAPDARFSPQKSLRCFCFFCVCIYYGKAESFCCVCVACVCLLFTGGSLEVLFRIFGFAWVKFGVDVVA